ncbi:MAG: hypothetical protein R8J94_09720 [Acidimicrobiia bacterium]|nr:hypothetical protein [Acidimicrobiia bacterium]
MTVIATVALLGVIGLAVVWWVTVNRVRRQFNTLRREHAALREQIHDQSVVLDATRTRLVKAEGKLDRYRGRLDAQSGRVARLQSDTSASIAELRRGARVARRFEVVDAEIDKLKATSASFTRDVARRNEKQDRVNVDLRTILRAQATGYNALLLREARATSLVGGAERLLILLTIHRSGSTTFFDVVRSHPDAFFEPTNHFWDAVGLKGRRYPLDLSDGPTADVAVEVERGKGALIPATTGGSRRPSVAVEKAHPQFFDFDVEAFATRIDALQQTVPYEISIAYGIRDPLEAMWSMAEYQGRNMQWYRFLPTKKIPAFIADSIEAIVATRERIPGPVIDYRDVVDSGPALRRLFGGLTEPEVDDSVFDAARAELSLERRSSTQTGPFVGSREPKVLDPLGPDGIWSDQTVEISRARAAYEKLIGR